MGAALKNLKCLKIICSLFERLRKATGLTLKPRKCVGTVVSITLSDLNFGMIKQYLPQVIPEWKNFLFQSKGKYLGIFIGPKFGGISWGGPMSKDFIRVEEITACKPPLVLACRSFNAKAFPVLGYVSQLFPPPRPHTAPKFLNSEWPISVCVWPLILLIVIPYFNCICLVGQSCPDLSRI